MARIVRPDHDFGPVLKDILRRLDKLERHNAIDNASAAGLPIADSTGLLVMKSGGFAANAGDSTSSTSFRNIANSSFTLSVPQPQRIIYMIFATSHMTAGSGQGYVRGNINGFDTSANLIWKNTAATIDTSNGFLWYFTGEGGNFATIPAGTYTVTLQSSVDSGSTIAVDQFFHQIFLLGA